MRGKLWRMIDRKSGSSLLPDGFRFGVATAGFQVEGGFNGPGEPANNWAAWEAEGRVEPSGIALDFWSRYEEHLDRVAAMGCDSFRMSVEWARVEPEEGKVDAEALARYLAILQACRARGIEPLVTLHHFTHPAWLGPDLWLRPDSPERFRHWAGVAVEALAPACSNWVTINELNVLALESYLIGTFPPGRLGDLRSAERALDNLLTAHIAAYGEVHRIQPSACVSTNNYTLSLYELDRLPADLLAAPGAGVTRDDLAAWLASRRESYYAALPEPSGGPGTRTFERVMRSFAGRVGARRPGLDAAFPRAAAALYASGHERVLDVVQVDYYDPFAAHHIRLPGHKSAGGRTWLPGRMLWDDLPCPGDMRAFLETSRQVGLELWVVENGMGSRVRRGRAWPRLDRYDRPRYLREHLGEIVRMVEAGLPLTGYWHWTLADNYEWGSYEPRFGIFGVDRERGVRWLDTDSLGHDTAGAYRRLIEGLRAGDASVLY
jgi:beta-glucosidase/6-phospho-beta-glucosidase/beta-galactosidase